MSVDPTGNEFARQPVPPEIGISGWRIAMIKIGVLIALPAFIMGAELGEKLGYQRSLAAFLVGAAILFALAAGTATVGSRTRLSTAMLIQFVFGHLGARAVSLVLAATLTGWFAVTTELFGQSMAHISASALGFNPGPAIGIVTGGILMMLTTIYGIVGLQRLAELAVPLLLAALVTIAWLGYWQAEPGAFAAPPADPVALGVGISAVVGSMAAGVTIFPDVCRFAHTPAHGRLAAFLTLGLGVPVVLGLAALPSVATGHGDLIAVMLALGMGVPALLFLIFTAWTTNAGNLYSSSLMMGTVTTSQSQRSLVIIIGTVGTCLALGGITDYLVPVLLLVGFSVPPIASIYIADFFIVRRGVIDVAHLGRLPAFRAPALVAWSLAVGAAFLSTKEVITLTSIPACDSILTAVVLYLCFYRSGWARAETPAAFATLVPDELPAGGD